MTILFIVVLPACICAVALAAVGRFGQLDEATHDRAPAILPDRPIDAAQLARTRFSVVVRGYRMNQVDDVLTAIGAELDAKDKQIAKLADHVATFTALGESAATSATAPTSARPAGAAQAIDPATWERPAQ